MVDLTAMSLLLRGRGMPSRQLDFPVFDADNHMYETPEALTKFLPRATPGVIRYVQVDGRTKIAVKNQISEYIPNPTFDRVAAPGCPGGVLQGRQPRRQEPREIMGRAIDALPAFREPRPASSSWTSSASTEP
jgi:hypothetical protein